jgi:hypothetical protein
LISTTEFGSPYSLVSISGLATLWDPRPGVVPRFCEGERFPSKTLALSRWLGTAGDGHSLKRRPSGDDATWGLYCSRNGERGLGTPARAATWGCHTKFALREAGRGRVEPRRWR